MGTRWSFVKTINGWSAYTAQDFYYSPLKGHAINRAPKMSQNPFHSRRLSANCASRTILGNLFILDFIIIKRSNVAGQRLNYIGLQYIGFQCKY